jgi:hypothetical protein
MMNPNPSHAAAAFVNNTMNLYRFTLSNAVPTALAFLHTQPPGSIIRMPASASRSAKHSLATFCASNGLTMEQEGGTITLSLKSKV